MSHVSLEKTRPLCACAPRTCELTVARHGAGTGLAILVTIRPSKQPLKEDLAVIHCRNGRMAASGPSPLSVSIASNGRCPSTSRHVRTGKRQKTSRPGASLSPQDLSSTTVKSQGTYQVLACLACLAVVTLDHANGR